MTKYLALALLLLLLFGIYWFQKNIISEQTTSVSIGIRRNNDSANIINNNIVKPPDTRIQQPTHMKHNNVNPTNRMDKLARPPTKQVNRKHNDAIINMNKHDSPVASYESNSNNSLNSFNISDFDTRSYDNQNHGELNDSDDSFDDASENVGKYN